MVTITEIGTLAKFNAAMPNAQGNVFALNGAITLTDAGLAPDSVGIYPPYSASETWPIDLLSYNIATAVKQSYEKKDITLNEWGTAIGSNWAVDNDPDTGTPGTHNTVSARTIDLVSTQTSISGGDSSYLTFSVKNTNTNDSIQWDSVVFEITSALGGTLTGGGTTYETYTYSNGVAFAKYTSPGTGGTETIIAYVKYYIDSTTASGVDTVAITVIVDPNPPVITVNRDSYVIKSDGAKYGKLFDIDFLDAGSNLDSAWIMTSSYGDTYTIFQTPGSSSYNAEWAVSNAFTQALGNGVNKCYIQARDVIGNTSSPSTIYIQKEVITATDGDTADWQSDEFLNSRRATSFRVAWDDTSLFINYDGAAGDLASEDIFVYIRTNYSAAPDQSATTINWGAYGTHTLPIECNVAFAIEDGATAKVYYNSSGTWTEVGTPNKDLFGGWSGKKSTELRVSWADFPSGKPDSMALVFVHQYDAASNLYNSLPLMNSANEQTNQTLTDYYLWDDLRETIAPNSFTVISTSTRSRSVDGEDIDWNTSYSPNSFDTSLVRDSEFIWRASDTDVRTDGTDPDDNYELKEFRVTSDQTNIYFLLKMKDILNTDTPLVIIGIDTDLISASGAYDLPAYSKTWTETSARYEMGFLACANRTLAYDWNYNVVNDGNSYLSEPNNLIEMSFPWSRLGVAPARRLRFTVIVCENNAGDAKKVTVGEEEPRALDGIAPSWMKTSQSGNFAGVVLPGDNTVDYYFDVDFDTAGWVIPHHITVTPSETYVFVNTEIPLTLKQMDFNENTCTTYAMGSNLIFSHDGNGTLIVTDSTTAWSNGQKTIKLKYNLEETITITCTETLHGKSGSFTVGFYVDTTQPNIWYVNDATYDANDSFTCAVGNAGNSGLSPFSPKLTINSVLPLLSDGDTVYIDAGTFQPGETLTIANNSVWLVGVDSAKTIIDFQVSTQAAFRSLYAANKNYVTVRDLQVKNGYFGIYFKTADYGEITRVNANTNGWIGIILESSADSNTVQYCYATGNSGYGFYLGDADRSLLRWNYALSNTLIGFLLGSGADTNTLIENKSKSNADGYKIDATSIGNIFQSDSSSNNSGAGFAVVSASAYNTFRSCTSTVDGAQGFYISDGGYAASNNQIIQCRIESSGADAIYVASHLCTATQNIISNPTGKGIYLNGSNDCTLDSNQVSWSTDVGIHVINNQRNTLRGNYVEHAKVDGIKFENSNSNTVSGCTTYAIVSAGFVVGGGSAYNNIMSCTGVQDTIGFYSDGGGNNNFNGIYLDDPKGNGFQILASNDTYSNCTVNGPDQNGFYLLDTATNNIFDTNRVISPASRGFYITEQSDTNKFRWNQVSNAGSEGFYLYNAHGNNFFYNFSIGHGNDGFKCEDTADSNAFHSDSTSGGTLSGFSVLLNSIHNSFSSCTALSAGANGFYINSDSTTLTNCRSRLSTAQGYYLLNSAFGTLSNCLSDYNTENNFYLNGADTNTVTSCTSVGAGNDGFKLDNSDGNLFTYNTSETSVTSGFAIMTGSYSNDFKLNKCTGATTSGFDIDENDNYFYRNLANNCGTNG
ncbi:TPA: hypothetical protein DEF17_03970, partial [bacterium]|nr:hypothetical protein [bacterium]